MRFLLVMAAAFAVLSEHQESRRMEKTVPSEPNPKPATSEPSSKSAWAIAWKIAVLTAVLTTTMNGLLFFLGEMRKAKWTAYEHKEARYHNLISAMRGTFQNDPLIENPFEANRKFFEEVDLCLMYCSDDVLRATWGLIDRSKPQNEGVYGVNATTGALKNVLYAIRRDMFGEVGKETTIAVGDVYLTGLALIDVRTGLRVSGLPPSKIRRGVGQ